jgi:hypothetical protein
MATVVNYIDTTLQSAPSRTVNLPTAQILLTPSAPAFHVATNGTNTPASITFTASLIDLTGAISFACIGGTLTNVTATSADLAYANMAGSSATVTASITVNGQTYSAPCTISKVLDGAKGADGAQGPTGPAGASAAYVVVSTPAQAFTRATSAASFAPTSITLTATPYGGTATYQWQYWTGSAWTNIAGATGATYTAASGDFTDARTYRVQATISSTVYTDQITLVQLTGGSNGANGANAISGFLTNEATTLAADSAGTVASFTPASGTFKVFDGITDKTGTTGPVTYSVPSQTGCTVAITSAGAYSVSAMSADTATATLQAVYGGVTIQKALSLAKSKAGAQGPQGATGATGGTGATGPRGPGHFYAAGSAWTDAAADAACPGGKIVSDVVTISNGSTFTMEKKWDGSTWAATGVVIDGSLIVAGSVVSSKIDTRGLSIKDASGNVILAGGTALNPNYAAPGTLNSDLTPAINSAAQTALWSNIAGQANAPANNASSDLVLVGSSGIKVEGNSATKISGAPWTESVYSLEGYTGGAFVSARVWAGSVWLGLNQSDDLTTSNSYDHIDYSIYAENSGALYMWSNGSSLGQIGTWTPGDLVALVYDGTNVVWYKGGDVKGVRPVPVGQRYFLDTSFAEDGAKLTNIRFGPQTDNSAGVAASAAINDPTTGLAQRLRANAANVLSGGAGLAVGSLTWNSSGVRTGGYGVGINASGIVGYKSDGTATFVIDASTGNASFGGTVTAAAIIGSTAASTVESNAANGQTAYSKQSTAFSLSKTFDSVGGGYANGTTSFGGFALTANNANGTVSYAWSISVSDGPGQFKLDVYTGNSVNVSCKLGSSNQTSTIVVNCTATDSIGKTATISITKTITWGTGG